MQGQYVLFVELYVGDGLSLQTFFSDICLDRLGLNPGLSFRQILIIDQFGSAPRIVCHWSPVDSHKLSLLNGQQFGNGLPTRTFLIVMLD